MNLEIGKQLGHYRILGPLGAGGMGEVYRARDTNLKRDVAVKILPPHVSTNPDTLNRFEREALALAQLSHPNILSIHDFGKYDGVTLAVTELLEGETLRTRIERSVIPYRKALEIGASIADGLAAAHSKGIIHRDLKPENIFLTRDDQVKILDFGLARMEPQTKQRKSEAGIPTETDPGSIKGTMGYMSPEQLRGQGIDGRSDIFSLGCILYEMLTGIRAFTKDTIADTMTAILKEDPPDPLDSGLHIPPEAERVIDHCLKKNPDERFQSARDLSLHLKTIISSPDISSPGLRLLPGGKRPWLWVAGLVLVTVSAVLTWFLIPTVPGIQNDEVKPSLAVLYFENHTGDESLDWLRTALTNLLITDLSQSPEIEVLSTDRLYQILADMGKLNEPVTSADVIHNLARQAKVRTVVLGSFIKAGNTFRLSTRLQDTESGRILATEWVEGIGESSLFSMVDDITRRIRNSLEIGPAKGGQWVKEIKEVTTSSVEAYKNYMAGEFLHSESKEREAIPYFEKATELDPGFAMAYAKLSVSHWNLGHVEESHKYAKMALDNIDRLTARERYYVEGRYYSLNPRTFDLAVQAYEKAIALYPDHAAARHNLANIYLELERYPNAIKQYEFLRRKGTEFAGTYGNLANAYALVGDYENGYKALREFIAKAPENAVGHRYLAQLLLRWGKLDDAEKQFIKTSEMLPGDLEIGQGLWAVAMLKNEPRRAGKYARELVESEDVFKQFTGLQLQAIMALHEGYINRSIELFDSASRIFEGTNPLRADALSARAGLEIEAGRPTDALTTARDAVEAGRGYPKLENARYLVAVALAHNRDFDSARSVLEEVIADQVSSPTRSAERRRDFMLGQIELIAENYDRAVELFERCEANFPAALDKGEAYRVSFSLGEAYWKAGRFEDAAVQFEQVIDQPLQALNDPIPLTRSLFYLGEFHHNRGENEKSKEYFRRFLNRWGNGSLDRKRIARASELLNS